MKTLHFLLFILLGPFPSWSVEYSWTTFAGKQGGSGYVDGDGSEARFQNPSDLAVDGSGNVYVADRSNHTIRKITPGGTVTTLAGSAGVSGSVDGAGSAARFFAPWGVAVDGSGNVYVTDPGNNTVRKITPAGVVTTLAGLAGASGSANGTGAAARFSSPGGVAVDGSGIVFVADNHTIRKITAGGVVTTLAGSAGVSGSANGTGAAARFSSPGGVAVDGSGNLYVADTLNHTIRKITPARVVTTLAGLAATSGSVDGTGAAARFSSPGDVAVDGSGNVYVADNHTIRKIAPGGAVTTLAGKAGIVGSVDGPGGEARFYSPIGVAVDGGGNLYVAEWNGQTIRQINPGGEVSTLAGSAAAQVSADGTGGEARFIYPSGVAADGNGNVYVADGGNSTIRKITPAREVTTLAGPAGSGQTGTETGSADGIGDTARFNGPNGVAVDGSGNVYVADTFNHTIRKITPGGTVTTLAGQAGSSGSANGTGGAARFRRPECVAVDGSGNLYVTDALNSTIRKITPGRAVTTLAGQAGSPGSVNGTGGAARFDYPFGVAVDGSGNVYVADSNNHTIRKIAPGGEVTTLAGLAGALGSVDGTGGEARFSFPNGVAVDGSGNVCVAESENKIIRKITPGGTVSTIGGKAGVIGSADGTGGAARFTTPYGVAVDESGSVYVADFEGAIRKGVPSLSGLESWRQTHFGITEDSGNAANSFDFDGDGLVNLMEFAFGLDPKAASSAQLPPWQFSDGKFSVSFPAAAGVCGITYGAEWSISLSSGDWTPVPDEGTDGAHAFGVPVEGRPVLFVRFTVTAP